MQQNNEMESGEFKLFKNNKKTEDWHADLQGEIKLGDKLYYLNCYVNTSQSGTKWFKGKIGAEKKPRVEEPAFVAQQPKTQQSSNFFEDIPFD